MRVEQSLKVVLPSAAAQRVLATLQNTVTAITERTQVGMLRCLEEDGSLDDSIQAQSLYVSRAAKFSLLKA